jgi:hypothetical protein
LKLPPVVKCSVMNQTVPTRKIVIQIACVLGVLGLAVGVRLNVVGSVSTLQDSVGPFWAAIRLDGRPHATPYGMGMLAPYLMLSWVAGSLWSAVCGLGWLHALVAPVAWFHSRLIDSDRILPALIIGAVVAMNPGLIDTFRSGAEGYLAPLWLGLACLFVGPWAWIAFALAVANHPLALAGLPLVVRDKNFGWSSLWGMVAAGLAIGTQALGWGDSGVSGSGPWTALSAFVSQGSVAATAVLVAPIVGLFQARTRPLATRVILSFALLLWIGSTIGYLRDHHIRLLTVPALVCWTALPGHWIWTLAVVFFAGSGPALPPEVEDRPGTLSLTHHIGDLLQDGSRPLVVDRIWFSGGPAVEPSAVMLDLFLRGDGPEEMNVEGEVVTIVAAGQQELGQVGHPGTLLLGGHGFYVARGPAANVRSWSLKHCSLKPRVGGAWDALSVLHPTLATTEVGEWWACPLVMR